MPVLKLSRRNVYDLYSASNIVRVTRSRIMSWGRHVARVGEKIDPCGALVGKPEGKRSLGRPRSRWDDNIKIYVKEICWGRGLDWLGTG